MLDSAFLTDPYPVYRALRAAGPIHWSEHFCGGAWLLTDYADVLNVLRDPRFSAQRASRWVNRSGPGARQDLRNFKRIFARSLLFLNGQHHTRVRQVMNEAFRPAVLQTMAPRIQIMADRLLDPLDKAGEMDFISDFARPLPAMVTVDLLGIDADRRADFITWSDDIAVFIGSPTPSMDIARRAQTSLVAMSEYFDDLVSRRRSDLGDGLVSLLLRAQAAGKITTDRELLSQCCTLLFAGHETTRNLLGNGLLVLLQHPRQWQLLKDTPGLMRSALRELLRFDSPVQYTGRRVMTEVAMHGRQLKRGDLVILLFGAANRDPEKFTDPDALDISRNEGNHLSFGYGSHVCVGAALTYLEAEIAFTSLMQRWPALRMNGAIPQWTPNGVYRGLASLWVKSGPRLAALSPSTRV